MNKTKSLLRRKGDGVILNNFPGYFLLACILVTGFLLFGLLRSFLIILIFAAILATAFYPFYIKVLKLFKNRARWASFFTCFLVLILIVVPLLIFILLLGRQSFDTYISIQNHLQNGFLDPYIKWQKGGLIYDFLTNLRIQFWPSFNLADLDLKKNIADTAQTVTSFVVTQSASILKGFGVLLIGFFILFFAMYYLFKDAKAIVKKLMVLSPLPLEYEYELGRKFKEISLATLYGIFLTSIVQGVAGGIGFAIAGIPNSLFWGTAIAIFSLVPFFGTSTIWLPASILLLIGGNIFGGIFLFCWGLLLVSTIDNFLRSYLIGERTKSNQLLTFLAVFGGLISFGLAGVILGPLILNLFFTFLHIYEMEYDSVL